MWNEDVINNGYIQVYGAIWIQFFLILANMVEQNKTKQNKRCLVAAISKEYMDINISTIYYIFWKIF